jgi:hypothetical protein
MFTNFALNTAECVAATLEQEFLLQPAVTKLLRVAFLQLDRACERRGTHRKA